MLEFRRHPPKTIERSGKDLSVDRDHAGLVRYWSETDYFFEFNAVCFSIPVRKLLGHLVPFHLATVTANMQEIVRKALCMKIEGSERGVLSDQGAEIVLVL